MVLSTVGFFALAVFGLGGVSVLTDSDLIAIPGLGPLPGVGGMLVAVVTFALLLWLTVRRGHPSFISAVVVAVATALAHLVAVWVGVLVGTSDLVISTAVAGDLVRGGASAVMLLAAAIGAWSGIALRRTRAQHPQWPWERDDEE